MNFESLPNCSCFAVFYEIGASPNIDVMWNSVRTLFDDLSIPIEKVGAANGRSVRADRATIARMLARSEISVTGGKSLAPLKSYDWRACGHFHVDLRRLFCGFEVEPEPHFQCALESQFFRIMRIAGARYGFVFSRPVALNPVAYVSGMNSIATDPSDRDLRMAWSNSLAVGYESHTIRDVFETNYLNRYGTSAKLAKSIECFVEVNGIGVLGYIDEFIIWRVPKVRLSEARKLLIDSGIIKSAQWVRDAMNKREISQLD